jgi:hypothetical protein
MEERVGPGDVSGRRCTSGRVGVSGSSRVVREDIATEPAGGGRGR